MSNLSDLLNQKWIKVVLGLKLVVVFGILLAEMPWVRFGEMASIAQDKPSEPKGTEKTGAPKKIIPPEVTGSYLDGLFQLPEIKTEKTTKEELSKYIKLAERARLEATERTKVLKSEAIRLKEIEKTVEEKISKLDEEKRFFLGSVQKEKTLQEDRLKELVELYGKMDPKKAAPIFEKMDRDLLVGLFQKLTKKQITKVLEMMQPDKALEVSEYFGRVKSGSEYDILKSMNESLLQAFADQCKKSEEAQKNPTTSLPAKKV